MVREPRDREVRIIAELDDGTEIQHVQEWSEKEVSWSDYPRTTYEKKIEIVSPGGDTIEIKSERGHGGYPAKWRERVIERLVRRVDEFTIAGDQDAVPVNIINEGKPAIVSYLYAIHGWSYPEIHEALDLTGGTIRQYIMAVANDNR